MAEIIEWPGSKQNIYIFWAVEMRKDSTGRKIATKPTHYCVWQDDN